MDGRISEMSLARFTGPVRRSVAGGDRRRLVAWDSGPEPFPESERE
jgi:hypothetical protein